MIRHKATLSDTRISIQSPQVLHFHHQIAKQDCFSLAMKNMFPLCCHQASGTEPLEDFQAHQPVPEGYRVETQHI